MRPVLDPFMVEDLSHFANRMEKESHRIDITKEYYEIVNTIINPEKLILKKTYE